jgi:hypothetical protein
MTPKGSAFAKETSQPRCREAGRVSQASNACQEDLETILIEERSGAVYFARIPDLGRFMASHDLRVHADVLKTLSDLVLFLVGEEDEDGSDSRG